MSKSSEYQSAITQSVLVCTPDTCRTANNRIYNSDLAVLGTYWSPYIAVGIGGAWIDGWNIEGIAGVVMNPLQGPGGSARRRMRLRCVRTGLMAASRTFWRTVGGHYFVTLLGFSLGIVVVLAFWALGKSCAKCNLC
ncbi:hypothetical protein LMH87_001376 [Akanthomyces muscarius]|uniref:Uncharacterized protein n=1 Tax=Akanthomyces muscarius TaxID=2231603 RepID=A0A9W8Q504_AKAMU|nr:hypothetical protein LMH87_001376 [Akanthomyces muscarius]KAJ4146817.1 hypothetical protein LMH87_001376 [Akanthomyces muscarius]